MPHNSDSTGPTPRRDVLSKPKLHVGRAVWRYFGLVLVFSLPFYLLGLTGAALPGPLSLPITVVMIIVPTLVAITLVYFEHGARRAWELLARSFDIGRISATKGGIIWLGVTILFMPLVTVAAFVVLRFTGTEVPVPHLAAGAMLLIFAFYFIGAIGEELGWQAYAYPQLRRAHSALVAALILGVVWALWHLIPYALMGRSAEWIFWQSLCTVLLRVIIVWLVVNAGQSVFSAVVFHAMLNTTWSLFPVNGSFYDPRMSFVILLPVVVGIVTIWGPKTLRGSKNG